jgi:hypothetical protein
LATDLKAKLQDSEHRLVDSLAEIEEPADEEDLNSVLHELDNMLGGGEALGACTVDPGSVL